jgi:hypothetical protein
MENTFLREIYTDGEKRGEQRGEKRGAIRMLRSLLELRFGKLPKWALKRLEEADSAMLERWGKKLLKAKTL